jgi:hypothetical protein
MPVLHLEGVPDELVRRLEALARCHDRPPSAEALRLLEDAITRAEQAERGKIKASLEEIAQTRYPLKPGTPDSVELLREDRAR